MTPVPSKRDPESSSSPNSAPPLAARLVEPTQMGAQPPKHVVDFAVEVSAWSPCRSKRGVVIFDGDDILTHGYNYKPGGFDCDGSDACKATCREEAVHAEQQALLARGPKVVRGSEMLHVKTVNGALVASGGPSCVQCSKLALVCGIAGVWLFHEDGWRRYPMVEFHHLSLAAWPAGRLVDPSPPQEPDATLRDFTGPLEVNHAENTSPNLRRDLARLLDNLFGLHFRPGHLDAVLEVVNLHAPVKVALVDPSPLALNSKGR